MKKIKKNMKNKLNFALLILSITSLMFLFSMMIVLYIDLKDSCSEDRIKNSEIILEVENLTVELSEESIIDTEILK